MNDLLHKIANTPDCIVHPRRGFPTLLPDHFLPPELREFYSLCGGVSLFSSSFYSMNIVSPEEFVLANPEILIGATQADLDALSKDITGFWYIIGKEESILQYITIDLGKGRSGRCYDSFWDRYAMPGYMPIIALSFYDLLNNLYINHGEYWYWLRPDFPSLGDAYD